MAVHVGNVYENHENVSNVRIQLRLLLFYKSNVTIAKVVRELFSVPGKIFVTC